MVPCKRFRNNKIFDCTKTWVPQGFATYFRVTHEGLANGAGIPGDIYRVGDGEGKYATELLKQACFAREGFQSSFELRETEDELLVDDQQVVVLTLLTI